MRNFIAVFVNNISQNEFSTPIQAYTWDQAVAIAEKIARDETMDYTNGVMLKSVTALETK